MVVNEVALALVLLVGAGLLIQTFLKLRDQYSGLRPEKVLTLRTVLPKSKYPDHPQRVAFLKQVSGTRKVAAGCCLRRLHDFDSFGLERWHERFLPRRANGGTCIRRGTLI